MHLTPDAIPTNEQLRESLADRFYHPYKKLIWAAGAILVAAIVGILGWREYRKAREDEMWTRYTEATKDFSPISTGDSDKVAAAKVVEGLRRLVADFPTGSIAPVAMLTICQAQVQLGQYDEALQTLQDLRTRFPDFAINALPAETDASGGTRSVADRMESVIKRERDWAKERNYVHHWPTDDRLALVETNVGSFWLGFYSKKDEAPRHVEEFVKRAKSGFYNGTQVFSDVQAQDGSPMYFEAGSKASGLPEHGGVLDPAEQDRDDPTDTIEPEDTRTLLRHQYRMVTAGVTDSGESASRFVVVTKREGMQKFDGQRTPFAAVMDRDKSLDTIDRIGRHTTYATSTETKDSPGVYRMRDHPYPAIYIRRVTIWTNEKLEDGHTWDTSRTQTDKPEPWESEIVSPKPQQFVPAETPPSTPTPPKDGQAAPSGNDKKDGTRK